MSKHIFGSFAAALVLFSAFSQAWGANANVVENPGFESGTTGWAARGYGVTISTGGTSPTPHGGSLRASATGRTATWMGIQQDMKGKMLVGQTYTISGWVRTSSSSNNRVAVSIEKTDGSGTTWTNVGANSNVNSGSWIQISGNYTLSVNGTLSTLLVYFECTTSATVDIYVDDVNVYGPVPAPPDPNVSADVNFSTVYQELEGFGAAGGWYEGWLTAHPNKATLYDILFAELGLDIYRVRNTYDIDTTYIDRSAEIVAEANASLGHPIKVMISSWSPPAYLKSNGSTVGGTLAKDGNNNYRYAEFAQWWADSLVDFNNHGIHAEYINMQNEPDWTASWDTCYFLPTQSDANAGYKQAFEALYTNLNSLPNHPKLLAPESAGIGGAGNYINALTAADKSNVYGYSHHLYDGDGNNPDGYIIAMTNFAASYGSKPLFQTEYSHNASTFDDAMYLAILMHNSLTVENVASYFYWDLFWASPSGLVSFPSYGSPSYTINPVYYAFKHYAKFTDPNWHRVAATEGSDIIRMSAYKSPDDGNMSIVIINTSDTTDVNLTLSLGSVSPTSSEIYRSVSGTYWSYIGTFNPSAPLLLPKRSITTVHLTVPTCPLQYDLTDDCLVDLFDLWTICDAWLLTGDCSGDPSCPDLDNSHIIDFADISLLGTEWGL